MLISLSYIYKFTFPFNWFPLREGSEDLVFSPYIDRRFPFNWFPLREGSISMTTWMSFHLLGWFPFNWFPLREGSCEPMQILVEDFIVFPFNWFPLREGSLYLTYPISEHSYSFHSIGFPCERGVNRDLS